MDLSSASEVPITVVPGERAAVPTGWSMEIPLGFEAQVRPRSGLSFKSGITVINSPGTIDSDYRGEVKVLVVNLGQDPYVITPGERIAQLVIAPVVQAEIEETTDKLSDTSRASGGFGHTG